MINERIVPMGLVRGEDSEGNRIVKAVPGAVDKLSTCLVAGTATGGSGTTIVDAACDFGTDTFNDWLAHVIIDDVHYYRAITDTAASTLTIASLGGAIVCAAGCEYEIMFTGIGGAW